jgi:hypothetical protein
MIECAPNVVDAIADDQRPLDKRGALKHLDLENVLPAFCIRLAKDDVRHTLLEETHQLTP